MPTEGSPGEGTDSTLKEILDGGALPVPLAVRTMRSMVEKLQRDPTRVGAIFPRNVVISDREGLLITVDEEIAAAKLRPEDAPYLTLPHDPEATLSAEAAMLFSLAVIFYQMLVGQLPVAPMDFDSIVGALRKGIRRERSFGLPVVELGRLIERVVGPQADLALFSLEDFSLGLVDISGNFSEVELSSHKDLKRIQSIGTALSGAATTSAETPLSGEPETGDFDRLNRAVADSSQARAPRKSRAAFESFGVQPAEGEPIGPPQGSAPLGNVWTVRRSQQSVSPRDGITETGQLYPAGGEATDGRTRKRSPSGTHRSASYAPSTTVISPSGAMTVTDSGRSVARSRVLFGVEAHQGAEDLFEPKTGLVLRLSVALLLSVFLGFLALLVTDKSWQQLVQLSALGWSSRLGFISAAHCLWVLLLSSIPVMAISVAAGFSMSSFRFLIAGLALNGASMAFLFLFHIMRFDRFLVGDERGRDVVSWVSVIAAVRKNVTELTYFQPTVTRYELDDKFVDPVYSVSLAPDIWMQLIYSALLALYIGFFIGLFQSYALERKWNSSALIWVVGFLLYSVQQIAFANPLFSEKLKRFTVQMQAFDATLTFNIVTLVVSVVSFLFLLAVAREAARRDAQRIA